MAVQFAQFADVQARTPAPIDAALTTYVNALLADASTVVKRFCRQDFVREQTTERIRPVGDRLKLNQRPVISVDSVYVIDYLNNLVPVVLPYWDGGDEIWLLHGQIMLNLAEGIRELFKYNTPLCQVTYTHGYDVIPDDIVSVVCSLVLRRMATPGAGAVQSQTAGPFNAALTPAAAAGPMSMTADEKLMLKDYRRSARTIELR